MKSMLQILNSSVIPWLADSSQRRFIVARPLMDENALPEGVILSPHKIKGKRDILKGRRTFANQRVHIAKWPEANLHEIAFPKLACTVSGRADYLLGQYSLHCGAGQFILIPPRTPHQAQGPFSSSENGGCTLLQAFAYSHGIYLWFSQTRGLQHHNDPANNYLIPNTAAVQILNLIMEEAVADNKGCEEICHGLLTAFFTILQRELQEGHYTHPGPRTAHESPVASKADFTGQIQEYLNINCHKPLRLEEVASHFYMSTSHFTRRVRQETGNTFGEMLINTRIERAKKLLLETDWTFNAIAGHLSFRSPSYFLSVFHRRTGCTPAEYRRQQNADHTKPQ